MCGIVGVATISGRDLSVERAGVEAMRDRLAHRGPDGAGLWWGGHVALGHRRLAVVGIGAEGAQPMTSTCGRHVLVYNGELYNDEEVKAALDRDGAGADRTGTDTETVLRALAWWGAGDEVEGGPGSAVTHAPSHGRTRRPWHPASHGALPVSIALSRLRGMYALAWYDRERRRLTLARDPLGIKPLVWWRGPVPGGGEEVAFASEAPALLGHPHIRARADWAVVSAYLTTIRTTLGERTLFDGVRVVNPGEWIEFDFSGPVVAERRGAIGVGLSAREAAGPSRSDGDLVAATRAVVGESIRLHLRSDVPLCALLSGGLDSTIVCAEARRHIGALRTYCAGARDDQDAGADGGSGPASPDFEFACLAASRLGTAHAEVPVTRGMFTERWSWLVDRLGVPLSTPNEVAIHAVAARLRADGHIVALSGEGADELFGGYDRPLDAMHAWAGDQLARRIPLSDVGGGAGVFALDHAAWVPRDAKAGFLRPAMWEAIEHDAALVEMYRDEFGSCLKTVEARPSTGRGGSELGRLLQATLLHQRHVNLVGLLGRLDGATMLAGVEGRTPLADAQVAAWADSLPVSLKFVPGGAGLGADGRSGPGQPDGRSGLTRSLTLGARRARTKVAFRRAFEDVVPGEVLHRPKASFPLPFQGWLADGAAVLESSGLVESLLEPAAIGLVRHDPARVWNLAWPVLNLAMWGRRWGW